MTCFTDEKILKGLADKELFTGLNGVLYVTILFENRSRIDVGFNYKYGEMWLQLSVRGQFRGNIFFKLCQGKDNTIIPEFHYSPWSDSLSEKNKTTIALMRFPDFREWLLWNRL